MYYPGVPANGTQVEKQGIYVPAPSPYAQAPSAYPQGALPPGMSPPGIAARYAAGPQAYAVVSQSGLTGYTHTPGVSLSYPHAYSTMPGMSTASPAYISAGQYPGGVSYAQTALGPRSMPPSPYGAPPIQAGAPLIAAGYSAVPGAIPAAQAAQAQAAAQNRSYQIGTMAAYPPGFPVPTAGSAQVPYHGATSFVPPY